MNQTPMDGVRSGGVDEGAGGGGNSQKCEEGAAPNAAAVKARSGGRRRSCNRCSTKKERCDGQEPCQRCVRSGLECLYATCRTLGRPRNNAPPAAKKRPPAPRKPAVGSRRATPTRTAGNSARSAAMGASSRSSGGHASNRKEATAVVAAAHAGVGGRHGALMPAVSLKRPSISASPATGLKGMVENLYLTCFMDDFAPYYRVLDDSSVRVALINLMTDKVDPMLLGDAAGVPSQEAKRTARTSDTGQARMSSSFATPSTPAAVGQGQQAEPPSLDVYATNSCVFSAMALGALLVGRLPSYVQQYVGVAQASLRVCSAYMTPVPNERVAAAHLLLAFATNVAGKEDYKTHIELTRRCYDVRIRQGLPTPRPIGDILRNRAIIDALSKPLGKTRVPAPKDAGAGDKVDDVSRQTTTSSGGGENLAESSVRRIPSTSDSAGLRNAHAHSSEPHESSGVNGTGGCAEPSRVRELLVSEDRAELETARVKGSEQREPRRSLPGLKAARERNLARKAEPLLMVCDIMTVLSKIPWAVKENAVKTMEELSELRSLMIAEKALAEERRMVRGRHTSSSDAMSIFTLNSAMIGLHCALDEFAELLALGRAVAHCVSSCPGLARYQLHSYHIALTILRAFKKRREYEALLSAVPAELRLASHSQKAISYDTDRDMCSMPVCVKHCKAVLEMGKRSREKPAEREGDVSQEAILPAANESTVLAHVDNSARTKPAEQSLMLDKGEARADCAASSSKERPSSVPSAGTSRHTSQAVLAEVEPAASASWTGKDGATATVRASQSQGPQVDDDEQEWPWVRQCSLSWALPVPASGGLSPIESYGTAASAPRSPSRDRDVEVKREYDIEEHPRASEEQKMLPPSSHLEAPEAGIPSTAEQHRGPPLLPPLMQEQPSAWGEGAGWDVSPVSDPHAGHAEVALPGSVHNLTGDVFEVRRGDRGVNGDLGTDSLVSNLKTTQDRMVAARGANMSVQGDSRDSVWISLVGHNDDGTAARPYFRRTPSPSVDIHHAAATVSTGVAMGQGGELATRLWGKGAFSRGSSAVKPCSLGKSVVERPRMLWSSSPRQEVTSMRNSSGSSPVLTTSTQMLMQPNGGYPHSIETGTATGAPSESVVTCCSSPSSVSSPATGAWQAVSHAQSLPPMSSMAACSTSASATSSAASLSESNGAVCGSTSQTNAASPASAVAKADGRQRTEDAMMDLWDIIGDGSAPE